MLSLFALTLEHVPVGHVGDGEEVRRDLVPPLAQVDLDRRQRVDRVPLVRVHRHAEQAGVGLQKSDIQRTYNIAKISADTYVDHFGLVARLEVPQHRRLVQVGQVGHVLALFELGRVHLGDLVALEALFLKEEEKTNRIIKVNR